MLRVVSLPGDGIGPEVTAVAIDVLRALPLEIEVGEHSFGGRAILEEGHAASRARRSRRARAPTPSSSARSASPSSRGSGAARARPDRPPPRSRRLRQPASRPPARGIDLLIVRELVGGLYYGASGRRPDGSAFDTCEYTPARDRKGRPAGVRACRRATGARHVCRQGERARDLTALARAVIRVAADYPDVELEHMLVDTAGLKLVQHPERFDVLLTENTFGDILSDVAAGCAAASGWQHPRAS